MENENIGFAKLMRWCLTTADFEAAKTAGTVTDDVLVIVLRDKVAKFKGETFDWSGGGGGGVSDEVIIENEEVTAAALIELNDRMNRQENDSVKSLVFDKKINAIEDNSLSVEEITAVALIELNARLERIENIIRKL